MKFAILLTVVALSAATTRPAGAQETAAKEGGLESHRPGAIGSALAGEAVRRAAAAPDSLESATRKHVQQVYKDGRSEWARVQKVASGSEVSVTVSTAVVDDRGDSVLERHLVSADDTSLTLLNLSDPALPAMAARALRQIASQHRGFLEGAATGGTFIVGDVRLAPTGVFVSEQKIADLRDIIETRARAEVLEIKIRQRGRGVWGHLGPVGGYFIGAMSGAYAAGLACQATAGRHRCDSGATLTGIALGGIAGAGYGLHAARRETERIIYRAPAWRS